MILITGSESFIGKEIIKQCIEKKIPVIGIDLLDVKNKKYEYIKMDICDPKICEVIPDNIDTVIHLAALSRDSDCQGKGYECFALNVMGTLNLINAVKEKNVKQFIFASTEWVYEKFIGNEEKDENDIIDVTQHKSEYALSKLVSEVNLKQQFLNKFCNTTILRFGIIYGPRKTNWSAIESIASMVKHNDEVTVGSLKTGRRFVHVQDIVNGIIMSIGLEGFNIINLTGDKIITLNEIIEVSMKIYKKSITINEKNASVISLRNPSNKKAKKILNWKPEINLEEGLKTIDSFI